MVRGLRHLTDYAGQKIRIHLRHGGTFYFTVTEATAEWINGFDEDGVELHIDDGEIAFIIG